MQDIIKEYGPALITVVAIISIAGLIAFLFEGNDQSIVGAAFSDLIRNFFSMAQQAGGISGASGAAGGVTP